MMRDLRTYDAARRGTTRALTRAACVLLGLGVLAASGLLAARASDVVYPPGLRVGLVPAMGMRPSDRFPGFEDRTTGTTVLVLEIVGDAAADASRQIAKERLKQQGIVEERRESFPPGGKGTLVAGRQEAEGAKARKWVLLLPAAPDAVAIVVVEAPDAAGAAYPEAAVRTMLGSVTIRDSVPIEEQLSLLPIRLDELSGMRPVRVIGKSGAMLTGGPKDTLDALEQPLLIVSVGRGGPDEPAAREVFARNLFTGVGPFKEMRIVGTDMLRLGGGPANTHQTMAEAKDSRTDTPVKVVQWIRFGSGAYLRIVGIARGDAWGEAFPRFRAVRDGVAPRG